MKWKQYLAVMTAAAMVISGPAVPMSQVFAADAVAAEVQASDETTDEKVITLPSAGEKLSVEAEDFTLAKKEGNDYIRIGQAVEKSLTGLKTEMQCLLSLMHQKQASMR